MDQDERKNRLKELIEGSASLSDTDRVKLIEKMGELNDAQIEEAIQIFEKEIEDWKAIYNTHENNKGMLIRFMNESQADIAKMSQEIIKSTEKGERETEEKTAESLLKEIG